MTMSDPHVAGDGALSRAPPPADSASNKWGPYSGAGDFGANMAIVLAALLCGGLLAFSLGATIRLLVRRRSAARLPEKPDEKAAAAAALAAALPILVFSAVGAETLGVAAECAICLAEFAEGDAVRVLPACRHGFHGRCIERWLAARGTCPMCRRTCDHGKQEEAQDGAPAAAV